MKKKVLVSMAVLSAVCTMGAGSMVSMADEDVTKVTWFASRPVDGPIDKTIRQLAKDYSESHDGTWELEVVTEADRPSYLEKLKTLIAGGNMPDIIDIDATPYCQELVDIWLT